MTQLLISPLTIIVHFRLHHTVHGFYVSRKGGTGGSGRGYLQGAVHIAAARAAVKQPWLAPVEPLRL